MELFDEVCLYSLCLPLKGSLNIVRDSGSTAE